MGLYTSSQSTILLVVISVFMIYMIVQSIIVGRKAKSMEEYALAGKSVGTFPLIMTMVGTATGGSAILGFTTNSFNSGLGAMWGMATAWLVLIVMNAVLLKPIRNVGVRYKMQTIPDFMAIRYGEAIRLPAAISILLAYASISGMQFLAIATFLKITTGMPIIVGTLIGWALLSLKCYFGGLKSVIWSDTVLGFLQTIGIFGLAIVAVVKAGGWSGMAETAIATGRPEFLNAFSMGIKDILVFAFTIGAYQIARQDIWQRIWAGKDGKTSFWGTWISTILQIAAGIAIVVIGTAVALGGSNLVVEDTSLFYYYAVNHLFSFPIGVFMILALMATIVSCGDSFMLSGASTLSNDVFKKALKIDDEAKLLQWSRYSVWITSIVALIGALAIPGLVNLWTAGTAMLTSGLLVPIIAAFYFKKANNMAGLWSCWGGVGIAVIWTLLGSPLGLHPCFAGTGLSLILMIVLSYVCKPTDPEIVNNCYYKNNNSVDDVVVEA